MLRTVQPYFKIMRIFLYIDLDSLSVYLFPINEKTAEWTEPKIFEATQLTPRGWFMAEFKQFCLEKMSKFIIFKNSPAKIWELFKMYI